MISKEPSVEPSSTRITSQLPSSASITGVMRWWSVQRLALVETGMTIEYSGVTGKRQG